MVFAANILHSESTSFTSMGEKIFRPPMAEISKDLFSTEREQAPLCGVATIEVAEHWFEQSGRYFIDFFLKL